jgi:hypothetical protein
MRQSRALFRAAAGLRPAWHLVTRKITIVFFWSFIMKFKAFSFISLAAGLLLPAAAFAQPIYPNADSTAIVNRLQKQERNDEFKAKFWSQEPVTQQDYYVQERQDRQLIARISAGEPVSQAELDQALRRVDTPY